MRAFYQRIRARRGHQIAIGASARKLAGLFWSMLTRGQDYAYAQPSLTAKKVRRMELTAGAGAPHWQTRDGRALAYRVLRDAERQLAHQAELAYKNTVRDWTAARPMKMGASATPGRASCRPEGQSRAADSIAPAVCASLRQPPAPEIKSPTNEHQRPDHLTLSVRESCGSGGGVRSGR